MGTLGSVGSVGASGAIATVTALIERARHPAPLRARLTLTGNEIQRLVAALVG
jgi:hypothetical protein